MLAAMSTREALVGATLDAMRRGVEVIYQGVLADGAWVGRPDFLVREATSNEAKSALGDWVRGGGRPVGRKRTILFTGSQIG